MNSAAMERGKSRLKDQFGAEHKWAVDDLRVVDNLDPKMKRIDSFSLFSSKYTSGLPVSSRMMFVFARMIPNFKNMIRMLRYEF